MIPVPIGHTHYTTVTGQIERYVCCEACQCEFVHILTRAATGSVFNLFDALTDRYISSLATKRAEIRLARALKQHDLIACPQCGWYQEEMIRDVRRRRRETVLKVGGALAAVPLVFAATVLPPAGQHLALGAVAGTVVCGLLGAIAWTQWWNPNVRQRPSAKRTPSAADVGIPLNEYRELLVQQIALAEQASQSTPQVSTMLEASALAPNVDDTSFDFVSARQPWRSQWKAQAERERRANRGPWLAVAAACTGASLGAFLDWKLGGPQPVHVLDRIFPPLFAGPLLGFMAYMISIATIRLKLISDHSIAEGRNAGNAVSVKLNPQAVASGIAVAVTVLTATVFGAGIESATARSYVLVISCQAALLGGYWLLRRVWAAKAV